MTREYVHRTQKSPTKDDSRIGQRTAVRQLPGKALTPQVQRESQADDRPAIQRDLTRMPVSSHQRQVVRSPLMVGKAGKISSQDRSQGNVSDVGGQVIQRQAPRFRGLSHELTASYASRPVAQIQAKLTIGQPHDNYEQEAERVAYGVVQQINAPASTGSTQGQSVQRQSERSEEELQALPEITSLLGREEPTPKVQTKLTIQGADAIASGEASSDVTSAINSARGGGQPLDAGLQQSMGQAMGADFSGVRVHTDARSDQLNKSIQAKAFTTGQDVFFRQGEYQPGSRGGQETIAHELTHVVQQNGGAVMRSPLLPQYEISLIKSAQEERKIQRKVTGANYEADNEETILGVLKTQKLDTLYEANTELAQKNKSLLRPNKVTATVSQKDSKKRSEKTPEYKAVGEVGKWEKLAVSAAITEKSLDVGHILADEFYNDDQKKEAYKEENLAPQQAKWNEHGYRKLSEVPTVKDVEAEGPAGKSGVKYQVELKYDPDKWDLKLGDLADPNIGALKVKEGKEKEAKTKAKQKIQVPRRMPSKWTVEIEAAHGEAISQLGEKAKAGIPEKRGTKRGLDLTTPYTAVVKQDDGKKRRIEAEQGHILEDPERKMNPARTAAYVPGMGRHTDEQQERAVELNERATKFKLLEYMTEFIKNTNPEKRGPKPYKKSEWINQTIGRATIALINMENQEKMDYKDVIKRLVGILLGRGYTQEQLKNFNLTREELVEAEAISDDEYSDTEG